MEFYKGEQNSKKFFSSPDSQQPENRSSTLAVSIAIVFLVNLNYKLNTIVFNHVTLRKRF